MVLGTAARAFSVPNTNPENIMVKLSWEKISCSSSWEVTFRWTRFNLAKKYSSCMQEDYGWTEIYRFWFVKNGVNVLRHITYALSKKIFVYSLKYQGHLLSIFFTHYNPSKAIISLRRKCLSRVKENEKKR